MTNRFLISVAAAALIAGTGLANAQGMNRDSGGAAGGGATAQQAPSERGAPSAAPANRDSGADVKGGAKGEKSAQDAQPKDGMSKDRAQSKDGMSKDGIKDSAQSKDGMKDSAQSKDGKPSGTTAQDSKSGATSTTGQAGAGAKLSTEQRTQISTVIKQQNVQSVTNVNFSISVGTRVPRDVRFYPLPAQVITIYPQWRGYNYILVREEIVIIDPNTFEIVAVISV